MSDHSEPVVNEPGEWQFPINLPEPAPELTEEELATVERFGIHDEDHHDDVQGMRFGAHLLVGAFVISAAISIGCIALLVSLIHDLVTR